MLFLALGMKLSGRFFSRIPMAAIFTRASECVCSRSGPKLRSSKVLKPLSASMTPTWVKVEVGAHSESKTLAFRKMTNSDQSLRKGRGKTEKFRNALDESNWGRSLPNKDNFQDNSIDYTFRDKSTAQVRLSRNNAVVLFGHFTMLDDVGGSRNKWAWFKNI